MFFQQSISITFYVLITIIIPSADCALEFKQTIRVASDLVCLTRTYKFELSLHNLYFKIMIAEFPFSGKTK